MTRKGAGLTLIWAFADLCLSPLPHRIDGNIAWDFLPRLWLTRLTQIKSVEFQIWSLQNWKFTCRKSPKCSGKDWFRLVLPPSGCHFHRTPVSPHVFVVCRTLCSRTYWGVVTECCTQAQQFLQSLHGVATAQHRAHLVHHIWKVMMILLS